MLTAKGAEDLLLAGRLSWQNIIAIAEDGSFCSDNCRTRCAFMEYNWTMSASQDDPVARAYEDRCHHIAAWLSVRRHQVVSEQIIYTPGEEELDEASTLPGAQTVRREDQGNSIAGPSRTLPVAMVVASPSVSQAEATESEREVSSPTSSVVFLGFRRRCASIVLS